MKRIGAILLGLPLALAAGLPARASESPGTPRPKVLGVGPAYADLSKVAVMHAGRKKPLDTLAREEVKQIFGRETIKIHDQADRVVTTWGPVAALLDWSARPEYWNDQPIILVEYLPLKRLLLADAVEARLTAIADRAETTPADRASAKALIGKTDLAAADLSRFAGSARLSDADRKAVQTLAVELGEAHKWLTPGQLEAARVKVDGQPVSFNAWFRDLVATQRKSEAAMGSTAPKMTDVQKRAVEVGTRLVHYEVIRDREISSVEPLLVMPRPSNPAYLAFCAKAFTRAMDQQGLDGLTLLQRDAANILFNYHNDIPRDDRKIPGKSPEFDKNFAAWLKTNSEWVPLRVLLDSKPEELAEAGYPPRETEAFLTAFRALDRAEADQPGDVPVEKAAALLSASRHLGQAINAENFPTLETIDLETRFNASNPFFTAPYGYGLALALLAVTLGFASARSRSSVWWLGRALYLAGLIGLVAGIALEVLGFSMRVRISGWAPVTNMYETVIWVSLVAAVMGLVFELIFRKTYAALAGAGVALLGTVLAANVPLLDPGIRALQPVLRSNYWLTIHVLTEVSSYAAFAMAMGLGMIATMYYLTATYRRSPSFTEVGAPLVPGLPMLLIGSFGLAASYGSFGVSLAEDRANLLFYVAATLAGVGGSLTIIGTGGILGELVSRALFREQALLDDAALAGDGAGSVSNGNGNGNTSPTTGPAATAVQTVTVGEQGGAVATLTKPTVAEIRARAAQNRPKLDARGLAMQATAAKIKPLSNFIYRTMQVGVLLIAAGTILGGVWADYSWGRFWGWDPKEVWALITLLVYLIPLHGRFAGWVNTFGLVMSSVICFLSVIMAWYGVNFVLGVGLHSYGFVEGGSQGVVGAVVLAVLSVAAAAAWRRGLASRVPAA